MNASAPAKSEDNWNEHWNDYAAAAALNPAQAYRRKVIFELLSLREASAPVRLLDLGSGTGDFATDLQREHPGAQVLGLDLSACGVEIARRKSPGAQFFQQDFTEPLEVDPKYHRWATHAVCSEVLEHLDDPVDMLRNVRPLLAPGCRLVVTVPGGPMSAFDRHIGHRRHFSRAALRETLRAAGLDVHELSGAGFPFFNLYRLTVVARGAKVIADVDGGDRRTLPLGARAAMRAFSWLFPLNRTRSPLGWQLVAVAGEPEAAPTHRSHPGPQ
jgi:2-polyprenyl-3-methyl-5-hydroxy-6-metoxy-1,4-benzoquinol methylase